MTTPNNGGPAFPVADQGTHGCYGMTLRDYFAAKAMQGFLSAQSKPLRTSEGLATVSYQVADAMLAARGES